MSNSTTHNRQLQQWPALVESNVSKEHQVLAIITPTPAANGQVSKKTPIFHLPVYKVDLKLNSNESINFHCDLADLADLIDKLKRYQNQWQKFGSIANNSTTN